MIQNFNFWENIGEGTVPPVLPGSDTRVAYTMELCDGSEYWKRWIILRFELLVVPHSCMPKLQT